MCKHNLPSSEENKKHHTKKPSGREIKIEGFMTFNQKMTEAVTPFKLEPNIEVAMIFISLGLGKLPSVSPLLVFC